MTEPDLELELNVTTSVMAMSRRLAAERGLLFSGLPDAARRAVVDLCGHLLGAALPHLVPQIQALLGGVPEADVPAAVALGYAMDGRPEDAAAVLGQVAPHRLVDLELAAHTLAQEARRLRDAETKPDVDVGLVYISVDGWDDTLQLTCERAECMVSAPTVPQRAWWTQELPYKCTPDQAAEAIALHVLGAHRG